ncbi:MAG TPA: hypothetical protein VKA54_08260, partial [Gemmatimonadaceae bacterium]|nr:hypothetical protein [Gemmatimonadaceae bacterium]
GIPLLQRLGAQEGWSFGHASAVQGKGLARIAIGFKSSHEPLRLGDPLDLHGDRIDRLLERFDLALQLGRRRLHPAVHPFDRAIGDDGDAADHREQPGGDGGDLGEDFDRWIHDGDG